MTDKTPNYTAAQTETLVTDYCSQETEEARERVIHYWAGELGKPVQSIRAKLVSENVYIKKEYKTKTGELVESKSEICASIASLLGVTAETIGSLEKANKRTLKLLRDSLPLTKRTEG